MPENSDRDGEARDPECEVVRPVEWIDGPDELPLAGIGGRALLGDDAVAGKTGPDTVDEAHLDRHVHVGDAVARRFPADPGGATRRHRLPAALVSEGDGQA